MQYNVSDQFTESEYTLYKLCTVVNKVLDDLEINVKTLPPQMFYNYKRQGYIKVNSNGKVSREDAVTWTEKFVQRRLAKVNS